MIPHPNIVMLARVAEALEEAGIEALFVGGATIGLYLDAISAARVRRTLDVDCVTPASNQSEYRRVAQQLEGVGFTPSSEPGDPICRWILDGEIKVDVMPVSEDVLGFTNRFYRIALATAENRDVLGHRLRLARAEVALAMKAEAYRSRGADDPYASRDLEDAVALLDGHPGLVDAVQAGNEEVRSSLRSWASELLANPRCGDLVLGHLGAGGEDALGIVLGRLRSLAEA